MPKLNNSNIVVELINQLDIYSITLNHETIPSILYQNMCALLLIKYPIKCGVNGTKTHI